MARTFSTLSLAAAMTALAAPALAQETSEEGELLRSIIIVEQDQPGDVRAYVVLDLSEQVADAVSVSTALANTASGTVSNGDVDFEARQTADGDVTAINRLTGSTVTDTALAATTAYGNAASGGTSSGESRYLADQTMRGDVRARTLFRIDEAGVIAGATTAYANVSSPTVAGGANYAYSEQRSEGSVRAVTDAELRRNGGPSSFVTSAGGNTMSSVSENATVINGAVQLTGDATNILARTRVHTADGQDLTAIAAAQGNSASLHNRAGYASLGEIDAPVYQGNGAAVDAVAYVSLDDWAGFATISAYGVGNSAHVANTISDTTLFVNQENTGAITSLAGFTGESTSGGVAQLSSTAIGNAAGIALCNICGDAAMQAGVSQRNSADVIARGTTHIGEAGVVIGAATAVGNSASFTSTGP